MAGSIGRQQFFSFFLFFVTLSGWAETHEVQLLSGPFRFEPNDLTIKAGDTVRWVNNDMFHSVDADDGSFARPAASPPWTFEETFGEVGEILYYCDVHSSPGANINQFMNGRLTVEPAGVSFEINQGIAASWFNESTSGQGFLIDVRPLDQFMFVAWFTFDLVSPKVGAADQRWFVASGNYQGAIADLQLFSVSGGSFAEAPSTLTEAVGTLGLAFSDCENGLADYDLPAEGLQGQIAITRAVPGTGELCQSLAAPAQSAVGAND